MYQNNKSQFSILPDSKNTEECRASIKVLYYKNSGTSIHCYIATIEVLQFIYVSSKVNCLKLLWTGKIQTNASLTFHFTYLYHSEYIWCWCILQFSWFCCLTSTIYFQLFYFRIWTIKMRKLQQTFQWNNWRGKKVGWYPVSDRWFYTWSIWTHLLYYKS